MTKDNSEKTGDSDLGDHNNLLEELEDSHRLDLAVHLYLTHLLHRVNPVFPLPFWSSWPLPQDSLVDPYRERYSDLLVPESFREFQDGVERKEAKFVSTIEQNTPYEFEAKKFDFLRWPAERVRKAVRRAKHNPKALMLNEVHASLQKVIFRKAGKLAGNGLKVNLDNTKMSKRMAVKLANKLDRLLYELKCRGYGQTHTKFTWQDVLMANMKIPDVRGVPDLKSYKTAYIRLNEMFLHRPYKYEYDPEDLDPDTPVPEFNIMEHLESLEQWNVWQSTGTALQLYRRREKDVRRKDAVIRGIYRLKLRARQLSHKEEDLTGDFEPSVPEYRNEIMKVFEDKGTALLLKDFTYIRPKW